MLDVAADESGVDHNQTLSVLDRLLRRGKMLLAADDKGIRAETYRDRGIALS